MEAAVTLLSKIIKIDEEELKKTLETNPQEVESKVEELQVYTKDEMSTKLINHTSTLKFDSLPDSVKKQAKDALYNEIKGSAFEKEEKSIAAKYGITEWSGLADLTEKIHAKSLKGDEELKNTVEALRETVTKKDEEWASKLKEAEDRHANKLATFELEKTLSLYEGRFDIPEDDEKLKKEKEKSHLEFIKYKFNSGYKLVPGEDGTPVVQDHNGNVLRDDNLHSPLSVSAVIDRLVSNSAIKLKESRKLNGRGSNGGSGEPDQSKLYNGADMSKFESFDDFLNSESGKGVKVGTPEANEAYAKFKEARK